MRKMLKMRRKIMVGVELRTRYVAKFLVSGRKEYFRRKVTAWQAKALRSKPQ
jgi:hypothetical protein